MKNLYFIKIKDNEYIVDGSTRLHDIGDLLEVEIDSEEFEAIFNS